MTTDKGMQLSRYDYELNDGGLNGLTLTPLSDAMVEWLVENVHFEEWQLPIVKGGSIWIEGRYAEPLLDDIADEFSRKGE